MSDENAPPNAPPAGPKMIEHEKFERVVAAKQGLEAQVAELRAENQALSEKTASVDTLAQQIAALRAANQEAETRFSRFQTIATAAGTTDPDVIDAVAWQHSRLPEEGRPELGEWIGTLKANPEQAPTLLRPLFLAPEPAAKTPPVKPKAPPGSGGQQPAGGEARATGAELKAAADEGARTGDWSRYQRMTGRATS